MRTACLATALLWVCLSGLAHRAESVVGFDFVRIGDPGNPYDPATDPFRPMKSTTGTWHISKVGRVDYVFEIARDEVTVAQYVEFLNAIAADDVHGVIDREHIWRLCAGYEVYCIPPRIVRSGTPGAYTYAAAPGMPGKPVGVHPYHAMRFMNWLHNGQPSGPQDATTTEDGAYECPGLACIFPAKPGARFWIPDVDEIHKASYWNPDTQTWHFWPTVPGVTLADEPIACSPGINPCPEPPTGNEINTAGDRMCHFPESRGCEFLDAGAQPATASPYGLRDIGAGWMEMTETPGETGTVDDDSKIVIHSAVWWGHSKGDARADTLGQEALWTTSGQLRSVFTAIRPARSVPRKRCGLGHEVALLLPLLWLVRCAASIVPEPPGWLRSEDPPGGSPS